MKAIVMTKKGIGTVVMTQNDAGYFFNNGITEINLGTAEALNATYVAYRKAGWTVKPETPLAAPTTKKERKTPENRILWSKDGKRIWATEYHFRLDPQIAGIDPKLPYKEWKAEKTRIEEAVKADMKIWEAENAPKINAFLQNVVWKIAK